MGDKDFDHLYKVLLIGDSELAFGEVYKGQVRLELCPYDRAKVLEVEGELVKLQVWDTAGQERFRTITTAYFRSAMGILLVYDCTDTKSYQNIRSWADAVELHAPKSIIRQLVANKVDLEEKRVVSSGKGKDLAKDYQIEYFETSAKTGDGVFETFQRLAAAIHAQQKLDAVEDGPTGQGGAAIQLGNINKSKKEKVS